ncbi:hypothetical protein VP01_3055g1 [Puccinia sorghi]|uniref:Uncharacterized protein n=1 Tax=Puccinia sorghi TaxID=27349 RepID=A0A0L6UZY5_9BASI|nr:hypothetical protein VP01_3055g1 [Puccinia sorghi]
MCVNLMLMKLEGRSTRNRGKRFLTEGGMIRESIINNDSPKIISALLDCQYQPIRLALSTDLKTIMPETRWAFAVRPGERAKQVGPRLQAALIHVYGFTAATFDLINYFRRGIHLLKAYAIDKHLGGFSATVVARSQLNDLDDDIFYSSNALLFGELFRSFPTWIRRNDGIPGLLRLRISSPAPGSRNGYSEYRIIGIVPRGVIIIQLACRTCVASGMCDETDSSFEDIHEPIGVLPYMPNMSDLSRPSLPRVIHDSCQKVSKPPWVIIGPLCISRSFTHSCISTYSSTTQIRGPFVPSEAMFTCCLCFWPVIFMLACIPLSFGIMLMAIADKKDQEGGQRH